MQKVLPVTQYVRTYYKLIHYTHGTGQVGKLREEQVLPEKKKFTKQEVNVMMQNQAKKALKQKKISILMSYKHLRI